MLLTAGTRTMIALAPTADGAKLTLTREGTLPARTIAVRVHRVDGAITAVDGALRHAYDADARALTAVIADAPAVEIAFRYDTTIADPSPPVAVTFEVSVPTDTPMTEQIHVATSANAWLHVLLTWVAPGLARGTAMVPRGEWLDYKYSRGSWLTVEKLASCGEATNRYRFGAPATRRDRVPN